MATFRQAAPHLAVQATMAGELAVWREPECEDGEPEIERVVPYQAGDWIVDDREVLSNDEFEAAYERMAISTLSESDCVHVVRRDENMIVEADIDPRTWKVRTSLGDEMDFADFSVKHVFADASGVALFPVQWSPPNAARLVQAVRAMYPEACEQAVAFIRAQHAGMLVASRDGDADAVPPAELQAAGHIMNALLSETPDDPEVLGAPAGFDQAPLLLRRAGLDDLEEPVTVMRLADTPGFGDGVLRAIGRRLFEGRLPEGVPLEDAPLQGAALRRL